VAIYATQSFIQSVCEFVFCTKSTAENVVIYITQNFHFGLIPASAGEEEIDIEVVEFSLDMICEKQSDDGQISGATRTLTFIPMKKMRKSF
jgi:hypothetical protein